MTSARTETSPFVFGKVDISVPSYSFRYHRQIMCKKNRHLIWKVTNGPVHNSKQNYQYHDWGRQCVQCCEPYLLAEDQRGLIERLLVERISIRGIGRAVGVQLKGLLGFLVQCVQAFPDHVHVQPVTRTPDVLMQRLEVAADARASLVQKQANKLWSWRAIDVNIRQVMAFHVGDRSRKSAKRLWAKMPEASRQHATFYTEQYVAYEGVIPAVQHRAISKVARTTNHLERFNTTLR